MDTSTFMAIPAPTPTTPFVPPDFDVRQGRLGRSTAFFSIATAFSRVAGLVREIVAASYFGISGPMSAFTIAFQVPNLVRSLFADAAIQAAFVPVFTEELEKGNKRKAFRLASTLIYLVTLVLGAVTALFVLLAPVITPIFAPGFSGEILDLTVTLSQILFPILILLGATGMVVGVLNSYDRFAAFAISPFFWNVVIIAVLVLLEPAFHGNDRIYAYAIGVLVGTVVQLAIPAWDLRNTPFRLTRDFDWRIPEVKKVLLLMLPVTLSLGLINFDLLLNSIVGTLVSDQAPAAIDKAFRIYMLPQGIFSVAVATVTFPTLARFAARHEWDNLRSTMSNGMRQILLLLIPAAAAVLDDEARLPARRVRRPSDTPGCPGALLVRVLAALQRALPAAHPDLLQPAAALDPDRGRRLQPGDRHHLLLRSLLTVRHRRRRRGDGDRDRLERRRGGRDPAPPAPWAGSRTADEHRGAGDHRSGSARGRQLPGLVRPRPGTRAKHDRPDRLPRGRPASRVRDLRRGGAGPSRPGGRADHPAGAAYLTCAIRLGRPGIADPVARARAGTTRAVSGVGELAAVQREAAAADALREPGAQPLELGDPFIDPGRPAV